MYGRSGEHGHAGPLQALAGTCRDGLGTSRGSGGRHTLYRSKAKNITAAAQRVTEVYGGEPPKTIAELTTLPGVARKTANIVLSSGYGINEGIAVDTHVKRITHRLGLTSQTDPVKVEQDLMQLFPQKEWGDINHRLVLFGRAVCTARSPKCGECEMSSFCPKLEPPRAKK